MNRLNSKAYLLFHLNLAFSSIESERRNEVIKKCYWPLLDIPSKLNIPIGIELTGWTLEQIKTLDKRWVKKLKELIETGDVELIGSGYTQLIGPLVPSSVNEWNQRLGRKSYLNELQIEPEIPLVNEMAFSKSLIDLYHKDGYESFIMDLQNISLARGDKKDIDHNALFFAAGHENDLPVIWADAILFQKFQQYIHADISLDNYLSYLQKRIDEGFDPIPIYSNDIEIFDFRPGRFEQERDINNMGEWNKVMNLLSTLGDLGIEWISPSDAVKKSEKERKVVEFTSCSYPIPVKKQPKYNIARWAVTGRNDFLLNTICFRIEKYLRENNVHDESDWKKLCEFWSSDYRTHITEKRWSDLTESLNKFLSSKNLDNQLGRKSRESNCISNKRIQTNEETIVKRDENFLEIKNLYQTVIFNLRRGCSIKSLSFHQDSSSTPNIGTIEQGYYSSVELGADFYTGNIIFDSPRSGNRYTDLEPVDPIIEYEEDGSILLTCNISFDIGDLVKRIKILNSSQEIELTYSFSKSTEYLSSTRIVGATFLPSFSKDPVRIFCKNGGSVDEEFISDQFFDHSHPSSTMVSSSRGFGATDGRIVFENDQTKLSFEWDPSEGAALPMLQNIFSEPGKLMRLFFSLREIDETIRETSNTTYFRYSIKGEE